MLEQYKLDFATYLETLSPEKQEEELKAIQRRKKPAAPRKRQIKAEVVEDDGASSQDEKKDEEVSPKPAKIKKVLLISFFCMHYSIVHACIYMCDLQ